MKRKVLNSYSIIKYPLYQLHLRMASNKKMLSCENFIYTLNYFLKILIFFYINNNQSVNNCFFEN